MDIVGLLGFEGQEITCIDEDIFCFLSGKSIYVFSLSKGPRDVIWRQNHGLSAIRSHISSHRLLIASASPGHDIEIIDYPGQSFIASLKNPTDSKIIDADFSRCGDKVFALSDCLQHKVFAWDLITQKLLFVTELAAEYRRILLNPTDSKTFLLFGDTALAICRVIEINDVSTVKFEHLSLKDVSDGETNHDRPVDSLLQVTFALWAPGDVFFFGRKDGRIMHVRSQVSNIFAEVGGNSDHGTFPTAATLSSTNLVVSTSDGDVLWYPLSDNSLGRHDALVQPAQRISIGSHISIMITDPSYLFIIAGTVSGTIHKFALDIIEHKRDDPDDEIPSILDQQVLSGDDCEKVKVEICGTFQSGAVLCCKSFFVPILSTSENVAKTSATFSNFFVTGSHAGRLIFWKQPTSDAEPISKETHGAQYPGIRRSSPRQFKIAMTCVVGDIGAPFQIAATCLEFLPFNQKSGHCLMVVGTSDGWLEGWRICAFDTEEEEEGEEERAQGVDDEEDSIVKLCVSRVSRQKMFSSAISGIAVSREDNKFYNVAISSATENHIYILKVPVDFSFNLSVSFVVELLKPPSSLCWASKTLWITCACGSLFSFSAPRNLKGEGDVTIPRIQWDSQLSSISSACVSKGDCLILMSSDLLTLRTYAVPSEAVAQQLSNSGQDINEKKAVPFQGGGSDFGSLSDVVICASVSPSGVFLATGSADGVVQVWHITGLNIRVASRVFLHSSAVLTVAFSADSSSLMSCGADGSVFISTIDEPTRSHLKTPIGDSKYFERVNNPESPFPMTSEEDNVTTDSPTWMESKQADALIYLRDSSSQPLAEIKAAVEDISLRLRILLDRNDSRNELEKMSRPEFVVDLRRQDDIALQIQAATNELRNIYASRNLWNELVAARVRQKCWDSMETHAHRVYPFLVEAFGDFKFVSTFSIHACSNEYIRRLTIIKRMRAIEMRSQRAHGFGACQKLSSGNSRTTWITSILGCPQTVSWVANDGDLWPSRDISSFLHRGEKIETAETGKDKSTERKESSLNHEGTSEGPVIAGGALPPDDDDDASVSSLDANREVDETDILNLLYPPQSVRTETQKRTQIFLLTEVSRIVRTKFNEFLEKLMQEKDDVIASIESRNVRINSILEELRIQEDFFIPKRTHLEVKGSVVNVTDDELFNRPYESEAMRLARLEAEEEKRRRDAEKDKEDVKGRALEEMMHGTLEIKRDVLGDPSSVLRPSWMDELSTSEMTDVQLKEFEEFEARLKSFQEEQVKYRKGLEQELKKLKSESMEACKAFDEKLLSAARLKIVTQRELLVQELYISRMSLNLARKEQAWNVMKKCEAQMADVRRQKAEMRNKLEGFRVFLEEVETNLSSLQAEEKEVDKRFKNKFAGVAQDDFKIFTSIFRMRFYPDAVDEEGSFEIEGDESGFPLPHGMSQSRSHRHGGASRSNAKGLGASKKASNASDHQQSRKAASKMMKMSKGRSSVGANQKLGPMQEAAARAQMNPDKPQTNEKDPFLVQLLQEEKIKRAADAQIPSRDPISDSDCPEVLREKFPLDYKDKLKDINSLRITRIEKEIEVKQKSTELSELKRKIEELSCEETVIDTCIEAIKKSRDGARNMLKSFESNLEVTVCLRQGQDEVNRDEVVTQYSDAILVPIEVVNKFNSRVKELGKEKIGVLSRIKQFRRKINLVDWEARHLSLEAYHLEEYFTDLQLLRVTRELQSVIRDGADADKAKERLEKVNARKDFMLRDSDARAAKLKKANDALRRQVHDRAEESSTLEAKIRELRVQLAARRSVKISRDEARGVGGDPVSIASFRMKKVVARRQLVDTARVQAEEIDFLRRELDRLRQKTFPSFVRAAKSRSHYPDERL